ncbi:hypothetical protein [Neogemmobacter tilapiae]|uniref:Uncharacterized protein n=1 Tax=Neogemmobacter tilapiae TaxID=875041 RepID=A0A918TFC2_9RHOB|nr:hypothetical protein [Gemmobacter tilapiae]GHC45613.1 hypothetical protein GCM10007315_03860 [Gemmobacter tilapiae]
MTEIAKTDLDPARLLLLARRARDTKALTRSANDRLADLRERQQEIRRAANLARSNADLSDPRGRAGHLERGQKLEEEADDLKRQISALGEEIDDLSGVSGAAAMTFQRAMQHAVEIGLTVPTELQDHVNAITRHPGFPLGMATTASAGGQQ